MIVYARKQLNNDFNVSEHLHGKAAGQTRIERADEQVIRASVEFEVLRH
jgi:hypothetical protein